MSMRGRSMARRCTCRRGSCCGSALACRESRFLRPPGCLGSLDRWRLAAMARPPKFGSEEKLRVVLSVLRGEVGVAETARRERVSETSIAKWRELFLEGGAQALADGARRGPSRREVELERRLEQVTGALGEAHVELRLLRGGGVGAFPTRSWR